MKLLLGGLFIITLSSLALAQSSYYHDYKSFFGKEDRIGLFSQEANRQLSQKVLNNIVANTLLVDCGTQGKPSTGFIIQSENRSKIVTAAHNVQLANTKPCKIKRINGSVVDFTFFETHEHYQNTATLKDASYDIATAYTLSDIEGYKPCKNITMDAKLVVPQSYDGTGFIVLSPTCKMTQKTETLITTTCRGHYKASGAPLLSVTKDNVCVLGVFNAHSGSLMNFESYAAILNQ